MLFILELAQRSVALGSMLFLHSEIGFSDLLVFFF
jgi:hypothetical protein